MGPISSTLWGSTYGSGLIASALKRKTFRMHGLDPTLLTAPRVLAGGNLEWHRQHARQICQIIRSHQAMKVYLLCSHLCLYEHL
jgi:hypothetical protein